MKTVAFCLAVLLAGATSYAGDYSKQKYKVTIVNVTKGQPLTPAVIAIHGRGFNLYELGEPASPGLALLAKDGATSLLVSELKQIELVQDTAVGTGAFLPGQKAVIEFQAAQGSSISLVSMLARTNDAFIGGKNLQLPYGNEKQIEYHLKVYDAGAEQNTELCQHIPAPPCNSHNVDTETGEGFVTDHPGLQNIGDLNAIRDAFGSVAARIIIERE